jgi:protein-tyrosine phosphatase
MNPRSIRYRLRALFRLRRRAGAATADDSATTRVLVVCTGNICRSPMARVVAETMARASAQEPAAPAARRPVLLAFHAAGTHTPFAGAPLDSRAKAALERHGYRADEMRSRAVVPMDFERFDVILAMDRANLEDLRRRCPPRHAHKLALFLDHAPGLEGQEVPDPYYGDLQGFEHVLDLCEAGARGLIHALERGDLPSRRDSPGNASP